MRVRDLSPHDLRSRLRTEGLAVRTGPFIARIQTPLPKAAAAFELLYPDFPLAENGDWCDFHFWIGPARGWKNRLRGRITAEIGGYHRFGAFSRSMAVPYLEWGLNYCVAMHAHQYLLLHAGAVERNGKALMILGPSGSGKSTLTTALALDGWRLLSDEMALISQNDLHLAALARPISLKNESTALIRRLAPDGVFTQPVACDRKGVITHLRPQAEWVRRAGENAEPGWLLFVEYRPNATAELHRVSPPLALMKCAQGAFNYRLLGRRGFDTLAALIERCPTYRLVYSQLDEALPLLARSFVST